MVIIVETWKSVSFLFEVSRLKASFFVTDCYVRVIIRVPGLYTL